MNEILNRFFVFTLPIQALQGIFDHSVEKSVEDVRPSTDGKKFIVKLYVGDTTDYEKYGFATEYDYAGIVTVVNSAEFSNNDNIIV